MPITRLWKTRHRAGVMLEHRRRTLLLTPLILAAVGCAATEPQGTTTFVDVPPPPVIEQPLPPSEPRVLVPVKASKKRKSKRTVAPQTVDAVTQFPFEENRIYKIAVSPGYFTALHLEPGELMPGKAALGEPDPAEWLIEKTAAGTSRGQEIILLIKPGRAGISTNLFIPTNRRTYQLDVTSYGKQAMDWVRWTYSTETAAGGMQPPVAPVAAVTRAAAGAWCTADNGAFDPLTFNRNYTIDVASGDTPRWLPLSAFSVGGKGYVEFPGQLGAIPAPALFLTDNGVSTPAPFRVRGRFFEVDRQLGTAELRQGETVVRIKNGVRS